MAYASKWHQGVLAALLGLILALVACRSGGQVVATTAQPSPGVGNLPRLEAIRLPAPATDDQRAYLGVPSIAPFGLGEIQTRILIIEFYSMYCPHCQRAAPRVNQLYDRIMQDPRLRSQVKLIGVAVGNTTYEIDIFRQTYGIRFPLFADRARTVSKSLGVLRTPTFFGIAYSPDGSLKPFLFETGGMENVEGFLADVIQRSGMELSGP